MNTKHHIDQILKQKRGPIVLVKRLTTTTDNNRTVPKKLGDFQIA